MQALLTWKTYACSTTGKIRVALPGRESPDHHACLFQAGVMVIETFGEEDVEIRAFFSKMQARVKSPPGVGMTDILWSWLGAVVGIGLCGYLSAKYFEPADSTLLIGSFGASAVLVYGAIKSPFAQPRNLIGGHLVSAVAGVACFQLFGETIWLAAALGAAFATAAMLATRTVHPPGGATAVIAVIGGEKIHNLGFMYVLMPVALGALILLAVALIVNNLSKNRRYPEYWL